MLSKKKKRYSQKFFKRSPQKNVFQKIFQALHKILTIQKIVLSSSRGQANFRRLEASRPRTSKCVLEDVLEAKDVLEDSTSAYEAAAYDLPQKSAPFFASIKLVQIRNKCYQCKLVCTGVMNEWCKILTIKTFTEVALVR